LETLNNDKKNNISIIEKDINKMLKFYNDNIFYLDIINNKNDESINKSYQKLSKSFKEYFLALSDYEKYTSVYDTSKKELTENKTLKELNKTNYVFSINKAEKYLSQFNGILKNSAKIEIKDYNYCRYPNNENIPNS